MRNTSTIPFCLLTLLIAGDISPTVTAQEKLPADAVRVLIVYHSEHGHTAGLAKSVEEGVKKVSGAAVITKSASDVKCEELLSADAVIVGSPVYWMNMSGAVKTFFDRWTLQCNVMPPTFAMKDKVGAAFATGGEMSSGKELTLMTILSAMLGNRMIVLSEGQALGATATTGDGKSPLTALELDEGRRLGERVARVAQTLKRGSQPAPKQ